MELLMDGSYLRRDGDVKWGAFLQSLNTCFIRISPEELHNLIDPPIWKYRRALHQLYLPVFAAFVCLLVSSGWTYPPGVALRDAAAVLLLVAVGLTFPVCFSALSLAEFHD